MHYKSYVSAALLALVFLIVGGMQPDPALARPDDNTPIASSVIHRGARHLDQALLAACGHRTIKSEGSSSTSTSAVSVGALVLDVTPHIRENIQLIQDALRELDRSGKGPKKWCVARLGGTFSPVVPARSLAPLVKSLLAGKATSRNTITQLIRTISSLKSRSSLSTRGAHVVYLADWQFEDEHDLEKLISLLTSHNLSFGVVGSEAAFGRGWNDGVRDKRDRMMGRMGIDSKGKPKIDEIMKRKAASPYDPTIGRAPFGPTKADAPWHGGDTAYPHLPYRFSSGLWKTEFSPSDFKFPSKEGEARHRPTRGRSGTMREFEDLLERRGRARGELGRASQRAVALPSSFGPYGLMRAAAMRGGNYVLWSWNPSGRSSLTYDFSRCNLFAPSLASRRNVKAQAKRDPLARALLKVWRQIGNKFSALSMHTPPLAAGGRSQPIDLLDDSATTFQTSWSTKSDHREFLRMAEAWRDTAKDGHRLLQAALEKHGRRHQDRRLAADAELLRHILTVLHFEISEALAVASTVPPDAWNEQGTMISIRPLQWINKGDDPENIQQRDVELQHRDLADHVVAERAVHLRKYGGTPFGVQVAANTVDTWVLSKFQRKKSTGDPLRAGRGLGESKGDGPSTSPPRGRRPSTPEDDGPPPGGSSGGGGPSTGGR